MPTHEDFKALKKDLGLKNKDIAEITGLTVDSVKSMTAPSKPLPSWAVFAIYVYQEMKSKELP